MEALRVVTVGSGSNATISNKEFHFHLHHVQYITVEPVTLYFDENESEDPISANELDEDGNDEDRTIELHFKDGTTVEIVYNESIYRKLKQYFNAYYLPLAAFRAAKKLFKSAIIPLSVSFRFT